VSGESKRGWVERRTLSNKFLRALETTRPQRNDDGNLVSIAAVPADKRREQVGELLQKTRPERHDLRHRALAALEQQRRPPTQALVRNSTDAHSGQVRIWNRQLEKPVAATSFEQ